MSKIKPKTIYQINEFANICGYFYNAYLEKDITANNGYNCRHKDCGEEHEGVGCCFAWSCPMGFEADEEDFANPEIDKNGYTEHEEGEFIILRS